MTWGDFRSLVFQMAQREGTPYIDPTDYGQANTFILRRLNWYADATHCLQSDKVSFTPIVGQQSYRTYNPQTDKASQINPNTLVETVFLASPMCEIEQVVINSSLLSVATPYPDEPQRFGESSLQAIAESTPNFLTNTNGGPTAWFQRADNWIWFNCPFDQAYANSFFVGSLFHSPFSGQDSQILDLGPIDIDLAAQDASIELLRPLNRALAIGMRKELKPFIDERRGDCEVRGVGLAQRGTGGAVDILNMTT